MLEFHGLYIHSWVRKVVWCDFTGNETFEKMASMSLMANLVLYLRTMYNLDNVTSVNIVIIWSGFSNILPLLGALLADAYLGKYKGEKKNGGDGTIQTTIWEDVTFASSGNHTFRMTMRDQKARTDNKYLLRVDCLEFIPIENWIKDWKIEV